MIPQWPEYEMTVSREAMVKDEDGVLGPPGEMVSLFQFNVAAIRMSTVASDGRIAASIRMGPKGSAQWTDEILTEWAEDALKFSLEHFLRQEGLL